MALHPPILCMDETSPDVKTFFNQETLGQESFVDLETKLALFEFATPSMLEQLQEGLWAVGESTKNNGRGRLSDRRGGQTTHIINEGLQSTAKLHVYTVAEFLGLKAIPGIDRPQLPKFEWANLVCEARLNRIVYVEFRMKSKLARDSEREGIYARQPASIVDFVGRIVVCVFHRYTLDAGLREHQAPAGV